MGLKKLDFLLSFNITKVGNKGLLEKIDFQNSKTLNWSLFEKNFAEVLFVLYDISSNRCKY